MSGVAVTALRVVIGVALAGSVLVQALLVAMVAGGAAPARPGLELIVVTIVLLGVLALQVVAVCVWRLLGMVRRGTVFSAAAFRYVDVVIGAIASAGLLLLGVAVTAAVANRTTPGDEVAPGLVGLICGAALVVGGVALVVVVLRALLAQAVRLDVRSRSLQAELDGVV